AGCRRALSQSEIRRSTGTEPNDGPILGKLNALDELTFSVDYVVNRSTRNRFRRNCSDPQIPFGVRPHAIAEEWRLVIGQLASRHEIQLHISGGTTTWPIDSDVAGVASRSSTTG